MQPSLFTFFAHGQLREVRITALPFFAATTLEVKVHHKLWLPVLCELEMVSLPTVCKLIFRASSYGLYISHPR
jgi:hypothetical protein